MLAVRGPASRADAYGVVTGADISSLGTPPHSDAEIAGIHLIIQINQGDRPGGAGSCSEISFDEADIEGTFHSPGHPGVIGLWLAAFTVAGTISDPIRATTFDPTLYEVPDLQPAPNGWMFRRGFVWAPPNPKRAYP